VRKLSVTLLAAGVFVAAYAAGACTCALAMRRRYARPARGIARQAGPQRTDYPLNDREAAHARQDLAMWARQAMFADR
jgi:hypothetical protein